MSKTVNGDALDELLGAGDVTGLPGFFWGMLEGGARHSCREIDPITIKAREGDGCTYEIKSAE